MSMPGRSEFLGLAVFSGSEVEDVAGDGYSHLPISGRVGMGQAGLFV